MSKGDIRRQSIFDKYTNNLNLLIDNEILQEERGRYICPICLESHDSIKTEGNSLTLEDAPPKSLGGKARTLTCQTCNNTCGRQIDFHLTERLRELDSGEFRPGTITKVLVRISGETLRGTVEVLEDGTLVMNHSPKNNHPGELENTMIHTQGGNTINMDFLKSRVVPERMGYALLKTGYLLLFEKFGYDFILDPSYDIVRKQLLEPEKEIYPEGFWTVQPFPEQFHGVYVVQDEGIESIVAIFQLDTGISKRVFSVFLPLPIRPIEEVLQKMKAKMGPSGEAPFGLYPPPDHKTDFLNDPDEINALIKWIDERK